MREVRFRFQLFERPDSRHASERVLRLMLEALTQADELYLRNHPDTPPLFLTGVRYQNEPPGHEDWDGWPQILMQGWGDCEDLVAARCSELRVRHGVRAFPDFVWRTIVHPNGQEQDVYHILVRFPDGVYEDPSRILGMGAIR